MTLTIRGQNFREPTVRLVRNGERLTGKTVEQTATAVSAEFSLESESYGPWDLVVENADGGRDRQPRAFELHQQP